ncbi:MAG: arginase family protein, partial [Candidatus Altiarchaeota archaeon]|nr:arginase family protein [Candidatus Altiarchaeota archaeon]
MSSLYLNRNLVLESTCKLGEAEYVLLGVPYDGTCTYRPGSRFAPLEVRREFLELEKENEGKSFFDL